MIEFPSETETSPPPAREAPPAVEADPVPERVRTIDDYTPPPPPPPFVPAKIRADAYGEIESGWALPLRPDEEIRFDLIESAAPAADTAWISRASHRGSVERVERIEWALAGGRLGRTSDGRYVLKAPSAPGAHKLVLTKRMEIREEGETPVVFPEVRFELTVLTMAPYDRHGNGGVDGYPVGLYPDETRERQSAFVSEHQDLYRAPEFMVPVNPRLAELRVSSRFALGDFASIMEEGRRHYIALDRRLIDFLETAVTRLSAQFGEAADGNPVTILVGYLSPNHVEQLRRKGINYPLFTRYQYGDGVSLVWDADGDGRMDDLNGDESADERDARLLADELEKLQRATGRFGGIGAAAAPKIPGLPATPYVDLDMRGFASRW